MVLGVTMVALICAIWLNLTFAAHPSVRMKSHRPPTFLAHCEICQLDFRVEDAWDQHLEGKRHAANVLHWKSPEKVHEEFLESAPNWAEGCSVEDVAALWDRDKELSSEKLGFRYRSGGTLHPSQMLSKCPPYTKARVWRYLRHAIGPGHTAHYKEIATILAHVEGQPDGFLRIKEIFESIESFRVIETFILAAQRTRAKMGLAPYDKIVELAAGHGLVGTLLAYRFGVGANKLKVSLYDLHRRPFYDLLIDAFEKHGEKADQKASSVLPNIEFHEADIALASSEIDSNTIVVSVHGCNEINRDTIEMATDRNAAWGVLPCCMRSELYVGQTCTINLTEDDRDVRHSIMCGSIAEKYDAQLIQEIDRRITNRAIFIGGGCGPSEEVGGGGGRENGLGYEAGGAARATYGDGELTRIAKRKTLPRLLMS